MTIWLNTTLDPKPTAHLAASIAPRRLVQSPLSTPELLAPPRIDDTFSDADIAIGQPHPDDLLRSKKLRWLSVTSSGYTRYEPILEELRARGIRLTNVASVFAEPCAQHVLAMMLALSRRLLVAHKNQLTDRAWPRLENLTRSRLLNGETALILGYGTIARHLTRLLAPFNMRLLALRRRAISEPGIHIISEEKLTAALSEADHIINLLPDNESTQNYLNARRLSACKPTARLYNIGRGTTLDHHALAHALSNRQLAAAYLDVTNPEPLPPDHPLWTTPNCHITPHTAGGRDDQSAALVEHFLKNLQNFEDGKPLTDQII